MKFSILIATYNRAALIGDTLASLARLHPGAPWEVIVVNNRCTDNTDALVEGQNFPVPLRLVHEADAG